MSFLRGSQNYVWSTTSVLGKGATGAVYQGVNKLNGEPVAVKTFNQISQLRPLDVQMREFEVLKKVDHENIVKLLAIEEEQDNRGKVIVMQLCTGGSLFNILDDPENTYGFSETEFLRVLEDLTAGMKHLRDNHLVHRDLKPGNIMKFVRDDGIAVYKLTDFGAARELSEGQQFQSLYGTEEYLHPDLYERAVLKKPANKTFGATIDLWSIGVTLYHVATGNLPFRPYGGRKNKETMYHITTKKASGVISGIQVSEDGQIEWRRTLPDTCTRLSAGLKKIITPLLAGLLEADSKRIWSFEKFFAQVQDILARICVNVFYVNEGRLLKVYIHAEESFGNFQAYVTEQCTVEAHNQLFVHDGRTLIGNGQYLASSLPKTSDDQEPVVLFNTDDNNICMQSQNGTEAEPQLPKFQEFSSVTSVESDAAQAKMACSLGYVCRRRVEQHARVCELFDHSVVQFCQYLNFLLMQLNNCCQHLLEMTAMHRKLAQFIRSCQQILIICKVSGTAASSSTDGTSTTAAGHNDLISLKEISETFVLELSKNVSQLHRTHGIENNLKSKWDSLSVNLSNPVKSRASARAKTEVERLRDSWQHLVRDRATRTLSYNDEQFHILERIKITHTIGRVRTMLMKEVRPQMVQLAENYGDWYKTAQSVYLTVMILQRELQNYEKNLKEYELRTFIRNEEYFDIVQKHIESNGSERENGIGVHSKQHNSIANERIRRSLKHYMEGNAHINGVILENTALLRQLQEALNRIQLPEQLPALQSDL